MDTLGAEKAMLKNELTTIQEDLVAARDDLNGNASFLEKKKAKWEVHCNAKTRVCLVVSCEEAWIRACHYLRGVRCSSTQDELA